MASSEGSLQQFAWLYIRGEQSVYVRVEEHGDLRQLIISGPRWAHATYDFQSAEAIDAFLQEHRARLLSSGYQLHAKAERRADPNHVPAEERRRH